MSLTGDVVFLVAGTDKAEVWTEAAKLKVRGYLGPFYKTQTWVKGN